MDWCAIAMNLPEKFLIKNQGGGIINASVSESSVVSVHAAKIAKNVELDIKINN